MSDFGQFPADRRGAGRRTPLPERRFSDVAFCAILDVEMTDSMDIQIARPRWRSRRSLIALGAIGVIATLAVGAMALAGGARSSVRAPIANVTIDTVRPGVFHDFVTLRAKVVPRDVIYLDALEGGQVEQVFAQPGDMVVAGQRFGLIRFGSRVDVWLPDDVAPQVALGQRAIAGETVIGRRGATAVTGVAQ